MALTHATIGMSIADAALLIRSEWEAIKAAPERQPGEPRRIGHPDKVVRTQMAHRTIRDCGWCIGHSHGFAGLRKLETAAIKGLPAREKDHLSSMLNHDFAFIASWLP